MFDDRATEDGQTQSTLFHAAGQGYDRIVRALLDGGAEPNAVSMFHRPGYPLGRAVHTGSYEAVRMLLEAGADPQLVRGAVYTALTHNGSEKAQLLLRSGAPHNIQSAAIAGDIATIDALLEADPECLTSRETNYELMAVEEAAMAGQFATVRHLISRGSPTTLIVWASLGDVTQLTAGLDKDPGAVNRDYGTDADRLVHSAAANGQADAINLLVDRGAEIDATIDRILWQGLADLAIVDLLIDHDADPSKHIHACLRDGNTELAAHLIERGSQIHPRALVALTTTAWWNQQSPQKLARSVRFLLDRGVDPQIANDDGARACDIVRWPGSRTAPQAGYDAVLELLTPPDKDAP